MKRKKDLSLLWISHNGDWNCYTHRNGYRELVGAYESKLLIGSYKPKDSTIETQELAIQKLISIDTQDWPKAKFKGISLRKNDYTKGRSNIWEAVVHFNGSKSYIGVFSKQEEAAMACNQFIIENEIEKDLHIIE